MGTVAHLYTTGDNDPEIEPVQRVMRYRYCDGCGSFDLAAWIEPDDHENLERRRRRVGVAILLSLPMMLVPVSQTLGIGALPRILSFAVAGVANILLAWALVRRVAWRSREPLAPRLRFAVASWLWLLIVAAVEAFASFGRAWVLLLAGAVLLGSLIAWRQKLGSKIETVGLRCRQCGASYRHGTPFFTDDDANPLNLTIDDRQRALYGSPDEHGPRSESPPAES